MIRNIFVNKQVITTVTTMKRHLSSKLVLSKAYINGEWISSSDSFEVKNPANGCIVGSVPNLKVKDAQQAIDAAKCALPSWSATTAKERSNLLKKWAQLIQNNADDIVALMTAESGKPLKEAQVELTYGNSFVEWYAEEARRIYGEIVPSPIPNRELMVIKQALGVAALITPWNFPLAMITRKAGAALAAGCTLVIKPAEDTPLTALALIKLAEEAGFPKGVINIITSDRSNAAGIGELLCKSPDVAGISFTGSTEVGKILYKNCADGVKRISLELGGNAPFIVFNSANIDNAINGAMASKFRNCGQACVASNRFFLQEDIYDEFISKLLSKVKNLKVGNGENDDVDLGPLINVAQFQKVCSMVEDAKNKNAQILCGGNPLTELGDLFYPPTIISNVDENMKLFSEEVFGPVLTIFKFKTEEEALEMANNTRRGLAGYFYSEDIKQVFRVAKRLEVGMVGINESAISATEVPFGGVKESGIGREGSHHGIDEYVEIKYLCLGNLK